jgi:hypothetical protein
MKLFLNRISGRVECQQVTYAGTFSIVSLRTPRESFDLTRLASDLCHDLAPQGADAMDFLAGGQGGSADGESPVAADVS